MGRLIAVTITAVLIVGAVATTVAAASSSRSGTASITWERDTSGGGSSGGGSGGGGSSGGGSGNSGNPYFQIGTFSSAPSPEALVSIPNPQIPLGWLPETGGNYLIPILFLVAGMSFLLVYTATAKGNRSP